MIPTDALGTPLFRPPVSATDSEMSAGIQRIDLGSVEVGSRIERSFAVSERGDAAAWEIIGKSCSCLEAELSQDEEGRVLLSLQVDVRLAGPRASYVAVGSTATCVRRAYRLYVYGKNAHRINPTIGHLEADKGHGEYPVTIEYFPGDVKGAVTFDGIETDIPNLTCGEVKVEEAVYGDMKVFRFTVPLIYTVTDVNVERTFKETIFFTLNMPAGKRLIPFKFSVRSGRPPVELTPRRLFMVCSISATKPIEKKIRVIIPEGGADSELSIKPACPVPVDISRKRVSEKECILSVSVLPSNLARVPPGIQKGDIVIALRREGEAHHSVTLPVCVVVRE